MNMFELFQYEWILFSKSKYMNGAGFQILAYKSIPKSPVDPSPRAPPPPTPHTHTPPPPPPPET